ncbi:GntR family transcriptional regulator, partial [Streptomyces sp. T21Q-yed]
MTPSETNSAGGPAGQTERTTPSTAPSAGDAERHVPSPAWELLLPAASAPARARGRSLQAALREAVRSGRLTPGTRLPSSRDLAADLGVS